jgi:hypothetical protein
MVTAISIPFVYMYSSLLTLFPVKNGRASKVHVILSRETAKNLRFQGKFGQNSDSSLPVAGDLVSLGYVNIWNLAGGMVEWEWAGFEIEE